MTLKKNCFVFSKTDFADILAFFTVKLINKLNKKKSKKLFALNKKACKLKVLYCCYQHTIQKEAGKEQKEEESYIYTLN